MLNYTHNYALISFNGESLGSIQIIILQTLFLMAKMKLITGFADGTSTSDTALGGEASVSDPDADFSSTTSGCCESNSGSSKFPGSPEN